MPDADSKRVHCHQASARQPAAATITSAMSAGLLRRVVDTIQRYRAVLRPDELVQTRCRGLAVDRDDVLGRPCPGDAELVERGGEQADDVLGPVREVVADAVTPRSLATTRQPSLWIRPRTNSSVALSTSACCQGSSAMRRLCFLPGPCWGSRHGQCLEHSETSTHPPVLHDSRALAWHQHVDGFAAAVDDRRVLRVERDAQPPDSAAPRDAAVAEVQAEHIASTPPRAARRSHGRRRTADPLAEPWPTLRPAPPVAHRRPRYAESAARSRNRSCRLR